MSASWPARCTCACTAMRVTAGGCKPTVSISLLRPNIPRPRAIALVVLLGVLSAALPGASATTSPTPMPAVPDPGAALPGDDAVLLFHTLQVDFFNEDDQTVYVQTGDIPAMWLRDSAAQVRPYVRFAPSAPRLAASIRGVI